MISRLKDNVIWLLVISCVLIVLSFGLGLMVRDWPLLEIDRTIQIADSISIAMSVLLAILIPVYIKYFIETGNRVNEMALSEIVRYRNQIDEIHHRFYSIYQTGRITNSQKAELNVLCDILDAKYEAVKTIVTERCKSNAEKLLNDLMMAQIEFWKCLTGAPINSARIRSISPQTLSDEIQFNQAIIDIIIKLKLLVTKY